MDEKAIKQRIKDNAEQIGHTLAVASLGNPYAAEPDRERRVSRLQTKTAMSRNAATMIDNQIERLEDAPSADAAKAANGDNDFSKNVIGGPIDAAAEKIWGNSVDFVNVSFLEKGARIARSVGRVAFHNSRALGSGFLIGEGLFLTNHHVVGAPDEARRLMLQFEYETDLTGSQKSPTSFAIDTSIFITSDDSPDGLDYSIFLVGDRLRGERSLEFFGWSGLSDSSDKHMLGEFANVVQHPRGRFKEVVLRENRLVARGKDALHYIADTEPGSSGSPVYNSEWRAIALHHWGSPWADVFEEDGKPIDRNVNEGIRISSIVRDIRRKLPDLEPEQRSRVERALFLGGQPEAAGDQFVPDYCDHERGPEQKLGPQVSPNGRLHWTVPVELSVGIPALAARSTQREAADDLPDYSFPIASESNDEASKTKPATRRATKTQSTKARRMK